MAARGYWRRWAYTIVTRDGQQFNAATEEKAMRIAKKYDTVSVRGPYGQVWPVDEQKAKPPK